MPFRALVALLLVKSTLGTLFTQEPRIEAEDGNLVLVAAEDRDVTLATSGRGRVTINGQDLQDVVGSAITATNVVNSKNAAFSAMQNDIRRLDTAQREMRDQLDTCNSILNGTFRTTDTTGINPSFDLNYRLLANQLADIEKNLVTNDCKQNTCRNGGTCIDLYKGFKCICRNGWQGRTCARDTNECSLFLGTADGCQNGAKCINTKGSYRCECAPGYYGAHCTTRLNNCTAGSSQEMCDHGTCVPDGAGIKCICDQGWTKAPGQVACSQDIDECITAPCSSVPKVNCINIPGSFVCESCPPGYTGNGHSCDDINECAVNNGGCSLSPLVQCRNTVGSFRCGPCPPGYSGDGVSCEWVGRCRANNGGCHPQAICQELAGSVQCTCIAGYAGPGFGLNGCLPSSVALSNDHPCNPSPCINGQCVPTSRYNFTCQCFVGYSGPRCENSGDPCQGVECANGGTCLRRGKGFRCLCTALYTGRLCTIERSGCGGFLGADTGVLEFPAASSLKYRPNLSCAWRIQVNASLVINATFDEFDLEPPRGTECAGDWLQIYDGKEVGSHPLFGKFCGNLKPLNGSITSSSNNLLLWFKSDGISNHMGFKLHWSAIEPRCGGVLNAQVHGVFSSPGAPGKYPQNRDCYWSVTARVGQRISFTFFSFNIEQHTDCSADYIEFFDGGDTNSPLISRLCTSGIPAPLVTPGNIAYVHFHSDGVSSDSGFQISYNPVPGIPGCGGIITDSQGEITPVTLSGRYRENLDCVWILRAHPEQRMKITFLSFDVEYSRTCNLDFLEVRHGSDILAPLAGRFCGDSVPSPILSQGSELYIRFRTDQSISSRGFVISYSEICGGTFTEQSGLIKSPLYPTNYPDGVDCRYVVDLPLGKAVKLDFIDFDVEAGRSTNCYMDFVEIRDGLDIGSPLLGKFCGTKRPSTIFATHNKLFIRFRTDASINRRGWAANYSSIDISCGGIFNSPTGVISSPRDREGKYPHSTSCKWVIQAPAGQVIELRFITFYLEGISDSACNFDYLEISDGRTGGPSRRYYQRERPQPNKPVRYCGSKVPSKILTTNNIAELKFKSDESSSANGFEISYTVLNASSACGGSIIAQSGVLQSPNYPDRYPDDRNCVWVLKVPNGQQIRLTVIDFKLEFDDFCAFDYVEIRNGGTSSSPLIGKYCGQQPPPVITSFSNQLYIRFVSDHLRSDSGFKMSWDGSLTGCGGLIMASTGSITSPNYPELYGRDATCNYRIRVALGSRVELTIVDLELEDSPSCRDDYLEVLDGDKSSGRKCQPSDVGTIQSSSNELVLRFKSDWAVSGRGFHLNYRTKCDNTLTGRRGIIESPGYPNQMLPGTDCEWIIEPERGHTINMTFTDLNINDFNCNDSYIVIKEMDGDEQVIDEKKFCSIKMPPALISSRLGKVSLKLVTSVSVSGSFRVEWTSVGCGGDLTKPAGNITSPNYPSHYPHDTKCTWTITLDPEHSVRLKINDISIEQSPGCVMDALEVYGGKDVTSPLLTQLCALVHSNVTLDSSSNAMTLVFRSDITREGKGFSATYSSIPAQCGGVFSGLGGIIHSRNFPQNFVANDDCVWEISVPAMHRVNFTFLDFDLPGDQNCTKNFVEVFDGKGTNSSSVLKVCGNRMPSVKSILSSSNFVTVRMRAEEAAKGFRAQYNMTCGALVTVTESGIIRPNRPTWGEEDTVNCSWTLVAPEADGHVSATVTLLASLRRTDWFDPCDFLKVHIFDGVDENSTKIGEACQIGTSLPFVTSGNVMHIILASEGYGMDSLASITYSTVSSACGGELSSITGSVASPGYPSSYPPNEECIWTIISSPGNVLQLTWKEFSLVPSDYCGVDYVEVRKGSSAGPLIGTYCGDSAPTNISSDSGLWLKFSSGNAGKSVVPKKFVAEWSYAKFVELSGPTGELTNPRYPNTYADLDFAMSWRITVGAGKLVRIKFLDLFIDPKCFDSGLMIYDGYDDSAKREQICGNVARSPFVSSSNVLYISFNSMEILGGKFRLSWEEIASSEVKLASNTTSDCGGDLFLDATTRTMQLTSPGYPDRYPSFKQCVWKIRAAMGYHLAYRLTDIQINPSSGCIFESVTTYDGENLEMPPKGRYCLRNDTMTDRAQNIIEVGSVLTVVFQSSYLAPKNGFSMTIDLDYGSTIEASNGVIDFTVNGTVWRRWIQMKNTHEWVIKVNRGRTIQATFESFDVAAALDGTCKEKYLLLRNGIHASSPPLGEGKFCGPKPEKLPETISENLYLQIRAPYRTASFRLRFEEVSKSCGGRLMLTSTPLTISTPNFPSSPPPHIECVWVVQAPSDKTLQIDFTGRFDLKYSPDCTEEYVEIRDGGSILSDEAGHFCEQAPSTIKSSGYLMWIKYFTNNSEPNNGFRAQVSLEKCGGVLKGTSGTLRSPGYPNLTPNMVCSWTIETDTYHQVSLNMTDFDMPPVGSSRFDFNGVYEDFRRYIWLRERTNCSTDNSVMIYEPSLPKPTGGPNDNDRETEMKLMKLLRLRRTIEPSIPRFRPNRLPFRRPGMFIEDETMLGVFCVNTPPKPITTSGNRLYIKLVTGDFPENTYRGFKLNYSTIPTNCGGELSTPEGIITSPYYPNEVPRAFYCRWHITAPKNRRIKIDFIDVDLVGIYTEQRLYIYDVSFGRVTTIQPKAAIEPYISSTSSVMIGYTSGTFSGGAHRGFKIRYSTDIAALCGGDLVSPEGVIEPPALNESKYSCSYQLPPLPSSSSSYVFTLENAVLGNVTKHCRYYGVGLFLESDNAPYPFKEICGPVPNQVFGTPNDRVIVKLYQSPSYEPIKFRLTYRISNCGGIINGSALPLTIYSPNYPNPYPANTHCTWRVNTDEGQTIKVLVEELNLEPSCQDFLSIINGADSGSPSLMKICNQFESHGRPIVSQRNSLFLEFHSDDQNQGKGFRMTIDNNHTVCGGHFTHNGAQIGTPNFPNKYGPNEECIWELQTVPGSHIGLVFTGRFYIEESPNCVNDSVEIYDFKNNDWVLINKLCGRNQPPSLNSTSPRMKIVFTSNEAIEGDGFIARWDKNCGGELTDPTGIVMSPNYPDNYPKDCVCEYFIRGFGQIITLQFSTLNLEQSGMLTQCKYDYIEIEELSAKPVSHGRFCGTKIPPTISSHNDLKVTFKTDNYEEHAGFVFSYNVEKCGGYVNQSSVIKYVMSKNAPLMDCVWNIEAPKDMVISMQVSNFSLPMTQTCETVNLAVLDSDNTTQGRLCGNPNITLPFVSTENTMKLILSQKFKTYMPVFFTAYITFTYGPRQGCGGRVSLGDNPETISSPDINRDGKYEEFLDCHWSISAKEGYFITAKVLSLDIDTCNSTNCGCDFLEVRDGVGPHDDAILKICGSTAPGAVASSSNHLWVRFWTDGSYSGKGFTIQFSSMLSPCGQRSLVASHDIQKLTSPGWPNNYPAGIRCSWLVSSPNASSGVQGYYGMNPIHIHIVSWDTEDTENCEGDYLGIEDYGNREFKYSADPNRDVGSGGMIYHGRTMPFRSIYFARRSLVGKTKYCGKGEGVDFYASSGIAVVEFSSNNADTKKGFQLEYSISACSRIYTGISGRIRNTQFRPGEICTVQIQAPSPNDTISLFFSTFAMPNDCTKAYLQVSDGPSNTDTVLLKACGYATPRPVFSNSSRLYVTMFASVAAYTDVDITYTTSSAGPGCGGKLYNFGGIFASPMYPDYVRTPAVCQWTVTVPEGLELVLKFSDFDIGPASTCNTDFVEFYELDTRTNVTTFKSKFCGGDTVGNIVGESGSMLIKYTRSVHNGGSGWRLMFVGMAPGSQLYSF